MSCCSESDYECNSKWEEWFQLRSNPKGPIQWSKPIHPWRVRENVGYHIHKASDFTHINVACLLMCFLVHVLVCDKARSEEWFSLDPTQKDPSKYLNPSTSDWPERTLEIIITKKPLGSPYMYQCCILVSMVASLSNYQHLHFILIAFALSSHPYLVIIVFSLFSSHYHCHSAIHTHHPHCILIILIWSASSQNHITSPSHLHHLHILTVVSSLPSLPCHLILIISQLSCHLIVVLIYILTSITTMSPLSHHPHCPVLVIISSTSSSYLHLLVYIISSSYGSSSLSSCPGLLIYMFIYFVCLFVSFLVHSRVKCSVIVHGLACLLAC